MPMLSLLMVGLLLSAPGAAPEGDCPECPPQCEMHVDFDESSQLFHAVYDTLELCGEDGSPAPPTWVLIDYEPDHLDMAVTDDPATKPANGWQGYYMRPLGPAGGPYAIQARSGYNNGRATIYVTIQPSGAVTLAQARRR
jgi:hypothetical protein